MRGRRSACPSSSARSRVRSRACATPRRPRRCRLSGSAYTYAYATMGHIVAWIIAWDLILEYALGATTVAVGWSGYAVSLLSDLGIVMPDRYAQSPFAYDPANRVWHLTGALLNVPAMAVIAAISALLIVGVHDSARVNNIIVVIKVAIIVVFVGVGAWFVSTSNWVTAGNPEGAFIPPNLGPGQYGWSGVVRGAAVVFFAYIGFDAVSTGRRRPTTRNATCRSAFSGRSPSAPCSIWQSGSSSPESCPMTSSMSPIRSLSASMPSA